ncbi:U3 small nucleolar ribonucleoprotein protein MPP10, putative [Plasmodium sp. DRC-Itaito]|nr:U3 small nucleolar ribonucleoprotein protein MPP10, putative [Plasmodium sp. DRC-Itaito]
MDEGRVKKYTDFINSFASFNILDSHNKCNHMENKDNLVDMIEYFCNFLIKYFYNDINMDTINIKESNLDSEQLWYLIECLIKKKKLNNLLEFFKIYEKQIDEENCDRKKDKKIKSGYKINRDINDKWDDNKSIETYDDKIFSQKKKKTQENKMNSNHSTKKRKVNSIQNKDSKLNKKKNNNDIEIDHSKNLEEDENQDRFFNFEEMESFLNKEEEKMLKVNEKEEVKIDTLNENYESDDNQESDEEEIDLNNFEDTYEDAKKMKYADFYKDVNGGDVNGGDVNGGDVNGGDVNGSDVNGSDNYDDNYDDDNDDYDDNDDDNYDDDNDDDNYDDDNYDDDNYDDDNHDDDNHDDNYNDESYEKKKLYDRKIEQDIYEINQFDSRLSDNEDSLSNENNDDKKKDDLQEKEKIEKELVAEKHWSLKGEAYGYNRPKNSILNLNFEIPKLNTYNNTLENKNVGNMEITDDDDDDEEDEEDDDNKNKNNNSSKKKENKMNTLNNEIETVVKQRIQNMLFDDVEKKTIEDIELEEINKNDEINFDNLNFSKSKISLVDEYTQKYQEDIMNSQSKNKEINLQKIEIMNLFKKIMHACDSLSNDYFIPKPILLNNKNNKMATLNIEDSVPMILSDKNKKTAEEIFKPQHIKQPNELNKDEKKSLRKSKKIKKKKYILNQFKQTGINQLIKRNTEIKNKNKKNKDQKINHKKYGVSSKNYLENNKIGNRYSFGREIAKALEMDKIKNKNKK